tara:strand:+ start:9691 stop:10011 length:321 start_codon:yes stop_codon:yes gene_type:complete
MGREFSIFNYPVFCTFLASMVLLLVSLVFVFYPKPQTQHPVLNVQFDSSLKSVKILCKKEFKYFYHTPKGIVLNKCSQGENNIHLITKSQIIVKTSEGWLNMELSE